MADPELQKQQSPESAGSQQPQKREEKDLSKHLSFFGGFNAIRGFMPDADNMNPTKKAAKAVFLTDKRFKDKRENLRQELKGWLDLLKEEKSAPTEYAAAAKENEEKYTNVLKQGITDALYASQNLERAYRQLDSFFKTANSDKVKNLRIINVYKDDIADDDS